MRRTFTACIITGCCLLPFAMIFYFTLVHCIAYETYQAARIRPNSSRFDDWKVIKGDMYLQVWLWNITNPSQFHNREKPVMQQVGPFTYRVKKIKEDITFNNNSTVSYVEKHFMYFEREMSIMNDDAFVTVVNFPVLTILSLVDSIPFPLRETVEMILRFTEPDVACMKRRVKEILWGYSDPFLKLLINIPIVNTYVKTDQVGLFIGLNGSDDGRFTVYTDNVNGHRIQEIEKWKGDSKLHYWNSTFCNQINGSDGSLFQQSLQKDARLYAFCPDLCRSVAIVYSSTEKFKDVNVFKFKLKDDLLVNSSQNPDNLCFDKFGSGFLDLSVCYDNAPVAMSNPHFLFANEKYASKINGMKPDMHDHETFVYIEPLSGFPVKIGKKMQLNFYTSNITHFNFFPADTMLPVAWMNQSFAARESDLSLLKNKLQKTGRINIIITLFLIVLGICLIVMSTAYFIVTVLFKASFDRRRALSSDESQQHMAANSDETTPLLINSVGS